MRKIARYGWHPDLPGRDPKYSPAFASLPDSLDWWKKLATVPACYDQGNLGSCVGNGSARRIHMLQIQQGRAPVMPSRLQIYFDARAIEGTTQEDSGSQIRDAVLSLVTLGVCSEADWPYDESRFTQRPPAEAYAKAAGQEVLDYRRVDNTKQSDLLSALNEGPVIGGFSVYESFESDLVANTGIVPMPAANEKQVGGHCVLFTGYDLTAREPFVWADNSWGVHWGIGGRFKMPLRFVTDSDLADDFWLLTKLE